MSNDYPPFLPSGRVKCSDGILIMAPIVTGWSLSPTSLASGLTNSNATRH
jgi:hypothetical protein